MKTTKKKARELYDEFHGVLRCLNGGTVEENNRNAKACLERLIPIAAEAARAIENPSKPLAEDMGWMELLSGIPARLERFKESYPEAVKAIAEEKGKSDACYVTAELNRIETDGEYPAKFQFSGTHRKTNHMNLTRSSAKALIRWLEKEMDNPANNWMN